MFDKFIKNVLDRRNDYLKSKSRDDWNSRRLDRHGGWKFFSTKWIWFKDDSAAGLSRMMCGLVEAGLIQRSEGKSRHCFFFTDAGVRLLDSIEQTQQPLRTLVSLKITNEFTGYLVDQGVKFPLISIGIDGWWDALKPWLGTIRSRYNLSTIEVNDLLNKSFCLVQTREIGRNFTLSDVHLQEAEAAKKQAEEVAKKQAEEARFKQTVTKLGLEAILPVEVKRLEEIPAGVH
jgi:hypothetical protein